MDLVVSQQRIHPVRGLLLVENNGGGPFCMIAMRRWMLLNRLVYKAAKIDVLGGGRVYEVLPELLEFAGELGLKLSLRTSAVTEVGDLAALKEAGLHDVFICTSGDKMQELDVWLDGCAEAGLPLRVQLNVPLLGGLDTQKTVDKLKEAGVVSVNVALWDSFQKEGTNPPSPLIRGVSRGPFEERSKGEEAGSKALVEKMNDLVVSLESEGIEANLLDLPLCLAREENLIRAANSPQFFLDHQQYNRGAFELAESLHPKHPIIANKVLLLLLARHTLHRDPADFLLLPALLSKGILTVAMKILRKATMHLRIIRSVPKPLEKSREAYEKEILKQQEKARKTLGAECAKCSLQRICDHETEAFKSLLPGLPVVARQGENVVSPLHFSQGQPKYYDQIDEDRRDSLKRSTELAKCANDIVTNLKPDKIIAPFDYGVEKTYFELLEGGVRWYSVSNSEKLSVSLDILNAPSTVSVTFAGGIAEYIGFSFGRHCKIVCPMETYHHTLTLHIAGDGQYVFLRDGKAMIPMEFEGSHYVPLRLPTSLNLRLSVWNIDYSIMSQFVNIWKGHERVDTDTSEVKYSILIVSTRYTRRLQAALRCIAKQQDIDLKKIEVVIAYVPGLDATDDLIDSMKATYPDLSIVRSPFPEQNMNSKGFMINESISALSGEWVMLLDADTLLPPRMFAEIEKVDESYNFVAPDGRQMLTPETTAKILMGELEPWDDWQAVLEGSGEFRYREAKGVPVGFCQCVRKKCLEKIKYAEFDHFEGADMWFGEAMLDKYGREKRLDGLPVLHLDHGGSQWYGTQTHR